MNKNESRRTAKLERKTSETDIKLRIDIDGSGKYSIDTGIAFFNHMLEQLSKHSGFDIELKASGDTCIDCHHTVEDSGILLGKAFGECIGRGIGIRRYGSALVPMDEALCMSAVDICGRANLIFNCTLEKSIIGDMDTEAVEEFFKAFCSNAFITLHVNLMYGKNTHHMVECIFKSVARSLKEASVIDYEDEILSTKGCIL